MLYYNGSDWINFTIGANGTVLTSNGSIPQWGSATANGLPTGGTANQVLRKIDGTNYNTEWHTLLAEDITDLTVSSTELNLLEGLTVSSNYINLVDGGTDNFQDQLNEKLPISLSHHAVWVGGPSDTAVQVSPGVNGSVFTIVAGHPTWQTPPTPGTVSGPVSSTDNAIVRWSGTGGVTIQDSGNIMDDLNNIQFANGAALRTSQSAGNTLLLQAYDVDGAAYTTFATLTANNSPTFDVNGSTTIAGAYIYRAGGTDVSLADGGTGASLSDPGANAVMVWDDTTNAVRLALLSGLTYDSGTNTLTASGGGGGTLTKATWAFPAGAFPTSDNVLYIATADKGSPGDADYVQAGTWFIANTASPSGYSDFYYNI